MNLTIITSNPGKAEEMKQWLQLDPAITLVHKDMPLQEIQDNDIEQVAKHKALSVFERYKEPFIVEDTGIFFEAYRDFPGMYTKQLFQAIGYKGILKLTEEDNRAYFKTVIAYMDATLPEPMLFTGMTHGKITREVGKESKPGMPYDSIFLSEGADKLNSELTPAEERQVKHRAKALREFSVFFNEYAKGFS